MAALILIAGAAWAEDSEGPLPPGPASYGVQLTEAWLTMPDGVRLAADLYLPTGGGQGETFPVLLEYLPYRKDESRSHRYSLFSYFVKRGYVVARVDIRGTGNSEGRLIEYEYSEQEQADAEVVIDWLASQDFSTGEVGMFGISWGGFNSIHMSMRNPPALKAIIAVEAADDLFQDDVHFMDGMMHVDAYEIGQDLANAMPGAPGFRIDEQYFKDRFDTTPWLLIYKRHQRNGPFWSRTAPIEHFDSIRVPSFLIGGWYDGYRDSVPRMLEGVRNAPVKAMVGPWSHTYPNWGFPGEAIEWRHEAVRWFDYWLKGRDTGIMDEPRLAVFVRDWHPPGTGVQTIPGTWRWEAGWPLPRLEQATLYLTSGFRLSRTESESGAHRLAYQPSVGVEAGGPVMWFGDLAWDQRPADGQSLVYDSGVLEQDLEILGMPRAILHAWADAPLANWFARLSDVAPDGRVSLVAAAGVSGAQRESDRTPRPLQPGQAYEFAVDMHFTSWIFPKGHRIRLAVNNALWPMIWPTPYAMTTTLAVGGRQASRLLLPVVPPAQTGKAAAGPRYQQPDADEAYPGYGESKSETESGYAEVSTVERNYQEDTVKLVARNGGEESYPWGRHVYSEKIIHRTADEDPARTSVESVYATTVELPGRVLTWKGILDFHSDRDRFYYRYTRQLFQDQVLLREKTWEEAIPRDHH
jgi:putative CocE/NonD family hydrolase